MMGQLLRDELNALHSKHISIVRGKGLLNAIVIDHADKDSCMEALFRVKEKWFAGKANARG